MAVITKESFENAVDSLMNASPKSNVKGKAMIKWIKENFDVNASVSLTTGAALGNRVGEQFGHKNPVVIFVCKEDVNLSTLISTINDRIYPELEVLLLMSASKPYSYFHLYSRSKTEFSKWIENNLDLKAEAIGSNNQVELDTNINKKGSSLSEKTISLFESNSQHTYLTALRTKPFMLLAGISGTGKSRIVRKLAQATTTQQYEYEEDRWKDNRPENFELIQVKPNWHNSMDVVGFYSNISMKYEFTTFVDFIAKAWLHKEVPYFLCLDEMNLAPVEEYFAEYLSAIESRSTDKDGNYITDPIIKPFLKFDSDEENTGAKVSDQMIAKLIGSLDTEEKCKLAEHFRKKGLTLPPNLMVIGTVNMDETTFSFSRKVLDRAMSIEMNEVDYDKFLSGESEQFPLLTDKNELLVKRPQHASEVKENIDGARIINYLKDVNTLFEGTPFQLGYRAANEAMLYVAASRDFAGDEFSVENALDEFTLMKILSRIEGDDSRLDIDDNDSRIEAIGIDNITDNGEDSINLLNCLRAIVRKYIGNNSATEKKINTMYRTLKHEHFVSYWA